jgi:preprotein translocase subunit SecB
MEIKEQPKMYFHGVDIVHLNFDSKQSFIVDGETQVDIDISPRVFYSSTEVTQFKIIMNVSLKVAGFFNIELIGIGNFEFEKELDNVSRKSLVNTNAPAIMFPYIRSFITTFTANLGTPTGSLVIPVYFFDGDLEEVNEDI